MNDVKVYNPNFTGLYNGVLTCGSRFSHNYPSKAVYTCPYADRLLITQISKYLKKNNNPTKLVISLEEVDNIKRIVIDIDKKVAKKRIPFLIKLFEGDHFNLTSEFFWNMMKDKKITRFKFILTGENIQKVKNFFLKPRPLSNAEKLNAMRARNPKPEIPDKKIEEKCDKFKNEMFNFFVNPDEKKWLNEFFASC